MTSFPAFLCEIAAATRIPTLTPIAVRSSLALKGVLENFRSKFERELGTRLDLRFDATQSILAALRGGEEADFLILTAEAISVLQESGQVDTAQALGSSGVGLAVRAGAPKPDIGSVEALKHALLSARSVAHSKVGASGIYFSEVLERLGVAGRLKRRIVVEKGPVGLVVASGEAEIGVQQLCELAPVAGIDIVGPLPDALQKITHFSAGIPARTPNRKHALALMQLLSSGDVRAAMPAAGIEPPSK
jgi:molybdate transport system substrate-binding protein